MPIPLARVLFLAALASSIPVAADDAPRVRVITPETASFGERFSVSGTLSAQREARLSPRVDGLVAEVRVDAGDRVRLGDLLLVLDREVARRALSRIEAEAQEADAALTEAERVLAEARRLGERQVIASSEIEAREAELALTRAALASARAAVREQREQLRRHELPAPFAGVIAEKHTESGEWVQRGTPVLHLVAVDRVRIDLRVPQERYADIDERTRFSIHPDAFDGPALDARLAAKLPVTDPSDRTFLVRLLVDDPAVELLPGSSVRAEVTLPAREEALALPRDALLRQPDGGYSVFVVEPDADGQPIARQRTVRVLRDQGELVAVSSGLRRGEQVVVRGNEALRDGQRVALTAR